MDERRLLELIEQKKYVEIKRELSEMNEVDVAELLDPLDAHMTLLIFRMLPKDLAVEVFAHFSMEQQLGIINSVTDKELEYIMDELFFDDMIDLIEEMPANIVKKVLKSTKEDEIEEIDIHQLLNQYINEGFTKKEAVKRVSEETGIAKNLVYKESLKLVKSE